MAISIGHLQVVYSGGSANENQLNSLGGAISTATAKKIKSQNTTVPTSITGVTIVDAMNNEVGVGTLFWNVSTGLLSWQPFGAVESVGQIISADGRYTLGTTNGYLVVDVTFASLPGSSLQDSISVTNAVNQTFDNVTANQSLSGYTDYRCFYILNTHPTDSALDVRLFVKKQPDGADTLALAADPAGLNGVALGPLADEEDSTNVLGSLIFSAPLSAENGISLGNLAAGEFIAFWQRRSVPSETQTQVVNNRSAIGIAAFL